MQKAFIPCCDPCEMHAHGGVALNMLRKIFTVCISVHAFRFHFIKFIIRQLNIRVKDDAEQAVAADDG